METKFSNSDIYHYKHPRFTGNPPELKMQKERVRAQKTDYSQGATATNTRMNKSAQVNFGGFFNDKMANLVQKDSVKKVLKYPGINQGFFESAFALIITCFMRPATILATPGSKKEDKQCASVQSMASGIIDFAMTGTLMKPATKAIDRIKTNIKENPEKYFKNISKTNKEKAIKNFGDIFNYSTKTLMIPLRSALTIALIPPTLKLLFPNRKTKSNQEQYNQSNYNIYFKNKQINNKVFANFLGVNK